MIVRRAFNQTSTAVRKSDRLEGFMVPAKACNRTRRRGYILVVS